ncbi:MAG: TonB-dependent receptor [Gammaproteobacteria bacterium]
MEKSTRHGSWRRSRLRLGLGSGLGLVMLAVSSTPASAAPDEDVSTATLKSLSVEQLMDLEVTSVSKRPEKLSETASAIQVITREDIRRSGATTLAEALRLASNLQVAQKSSHGWGISARGFNTELSNKLLVLIDGRTVYTPLYSGVFWDAQDYPLEDIERIEVISGPGGTLWGANAVNGVINITTRNARDTQGLAVEAGGGTEVQDFAGIRYGGSLSSNVTYRVYAKHFERDDSVLGNGGDASDSWRMTQGGFRLDAEPSARNTLTLQGDVYGTEEQIPAAENSRLSGANILGRWSRVYSEDSDMSLQAYYDHTHLSLPTPSNGFAPAGVFTDDLDTYDLDFQHHFRLTAHQQVVWGLGYRFTHDVVDAAPTLALLPPRLDHHLFSGFIEDKFQLRENLFLTLGSKLEHNDYTGFEYEPSTRLQWNYASQQMLWAAVSRAVRTPSRIDRDLREPTLLPAPFPDSILNGSDDFSSEKLIAYELGHRAQLGAKLVTSISLFYNDYNDIRSTTPGPLAFPSFGFPLVIANALEGETHGLELSAAYQPFDAWRLRGGYNLLKEHLRVKPGGVDFSNALNETADPEQQVTLHSALDLPASLQLDIGLRWVDTLHNNNGPTPGTVPSYFEADARIGWRLNGNLEFSVVGQNLLHDHHPEYGFPGAARQEIERGVYGKVLMTY